ncbi:MAG: DUF4340 domain-containing protein [Deltaproteobacteria bacterium]|nr:DUF4340 domain-containing protein [Deltaproteobacteria bacterium]
MSRAAWGWSLTLLVLLVGAYFAWTHEATVTSGESTPVVILDLKADQIDRVSFATAKREAVLEAKSDANGRYYVVSLTETVGKKADDSGAELPEPEPGEGEGEGEEGEAPLPEAPEAPDAAPAPAAPEAGEPAAEKKTRRFAGGRSAERLLDRLAPLTALRAMDEVPEERLEKLGLKPAEATFSITRGDRTWTFGVGGQAFGGSRRYLHEEGTSKVYLVEATALRNLEGAERQLLERSIIGLKREEVAAVEARSGERSQRLVQQNRADRRAAYWAFAAKPEEKSSVASGWIDKIFRLRVDTYVEAIPAGVEEACRFVTEQEGSKVEVVLHRWMSPAGEPEIYATSSYLRLPVKVYKQSGVEVIDDLGTLFTE